MTSLLMALFKDPSCLRRVALGAELTHSLTATRMTDSIRAFKFKSDDKSLLSKGKFLVTETKPSPRQGQYCVPRPIKEIVQTVAGKGEGKAKEMKVWTGTRLECSFPRW
jgi:hypothetical protein